MNENKWNYPNHPITFFFLLGYCASQSFVLGVSFFSSLYTSSVSSLDRGDPATETQGWDIPLPQLPHPVHRHPVPLRRWLSGLWKQLCLQSCHITPFILSPLRPYLAEKECVLHRGPFARSIWYSWTVLCLWGKQKDCWHPDWNVFTRKYNWTCMLLMPNCTDSYFDLSMWCDVW